MEILVKYELPDDAIEKAVNVAISNTLEDFSNNPWVKDATPIDFGLLISEACRFIEDDIEYEISEYCYDVLNEAIEDEIRKQFKEIVKFTRGE